MLTQREDRLWMSESDVYKRAPQTERVRHASVFFARYVMRFRRVFLKHTERDFRRDKKPKRDLKTHGVDHTQSAYTCVYVDHILYKKNDV